MKRFLVFFLLSFRLSAQTETESSFFQMEFGLCASLDYYGNHIPVGFGTLPSNVPHTYIRPAASLLWTKFFRDHFSMSTGLEYAAPRYYLSWASDYTYHGSNEIYLRDVRITVNTFTIPIYSNWVILRKTLSFGIGPGLDVLPYNPAIGTRVQALTNAEDDWTSNSLVKTLDLSLNTRIAFRVSIGTRAFCLTLRCKHGIFPLLTPAWRHEDRSIFSSSPTFFNDFCALGLGYIFK